MKSIFFTFLLFLSAIFLGQNQVSIKGEIYDTLNKKGVEHAVVMAVRVRDSVMLSYTRSDWKGNFALKLPIDTFQVLITHPKYDDKEYYIFGNPTTTDLDFGRIVMPEKGEELKEYVVFSNNEPIYFRGDTLVMVADSFKTAANANVEDLFKKLPGFNVDKSGKIMVHGKEVNKVFVDGDEFFGTDPTIATKNLPANAIQNVEVFDKKIDGNSTEETEKVINLTLKENAKKGYFGKVNGATDFTKFYEGEALLNRFKGDQKISVFGLFTNTPRSEFNWQDRYQYGLTEEMGNRDDDGNYIYEPSVGNLGEGLPQKAKTGFYFTDKLGKKVEIGTNFTYDNQQVRSVTETNTGFLLSDTTYSSFANDNVFKTQEAFVFNFNLSWKIDSLTKLEIAPSVKQIDNTTDENSVTNFFSEENFNSRSTTNSYTESTQYLEASIGMKLIRDFKKKDRKLKINYNLRNQINSSQDFLNNADENLLNNEMYSETNQKKNGKSKSLQHFGEVIFIEPLSKKLKFEIKYSLQLSNGGNRKFAFDKNGDLYDFRNDFFTSDFENRTFNQKAGGRFIYTIKKHEIIAGADWNNVLLNSYDVIADKQIDQNRTNVLPYVRYKISFTRAKTLTFTYKTKVSNPSITQLQPLPDNRNLNNIRVGNIDLTNQFEQTFGVNFFTYKATTGTHTYAGGDFTIFDNAFSQSIYYDAFGRAVNQTINAQGNQRANFYGGTAIPFLKQKFKFEPRASYNYSKINTEVNGAAIQTLNSSVYGSGELSLILDSLEVFVQANYGYTVANNSLSNSTQKFTTQAYSAGFEWKMPFKFEIASDVEYILNTQRAEGFDLNYVLWNASISRKFLEKETLVISVEANDLLNQNISNTRSVYNNIVVDRKTNIIGRYILLRAVYKFNVLKSNKKDEDLH